MARLFSVAGYGKEGYDKYGYGKDGYGKDGYDKYGYGKDGYDKYGEFLVPAGGCAAELLSTCTTCLLDSWLCSNWAALPPLQACQ